MHKNNSLLDFLGVFNSQNSQSQPDKNQITNYLNPQETESKENCDKNSNKNNNNNDDDEKPTVQNGFQHLLDEEDDAMLQLDLDF